MTRLKLVPVRLEVGDVHKLEILGELIGWDVPTVIASAVNRFLEDHHDEISEYALIRVASSVRRTRRTATTPQMGGSQ